jgi:hypothetical protein
MQNGTEKCPSAVDGRKNPKQNSRLLNGQQQKNIIRSEMASAATTLFSSEADANNVYFDY